MSFVLSFFFVFCFEVLSTSPISGSRRLLLKSVLLVIIFKFQVLPGFLEFLFCSFDLESLFSTLSSGETRDTRPVS